MKAKLNQRLLKIAELVPMNASIIDVGCDHALFIFLKIKNLKK
jgi:tRNA A22 N-methylase